jgi:hypothetical protein
MDKSAGTLRHVDADLLPRSGLKRLALIRLQEFDLAQSRRTRHAADISKMTSNLQGSYDAVSPGKPGAGLTGYRDHDQSNQGWLGARRGNRSVALDLVTAGGVRLGAAVYRLRILDALRKAGLCHSTL